MAEEAGLSALCTTVQGDAQYLPFEDAEFDAALAVYALKYFPSLKQVFSEVHRVLKPGASFLIYDIVKTEAYDPSNSEHCEVVEGFEYACGMPVHPHHR